MPSHVLRGEAMSLSMLLVAALLAQSPAEPPEPARPFHPAVRILAELGGGYVGAAALAVPVTLIALSTMPAGCTASDPDCHYDWDFLVVGAGLVGLGVGTWLGGWAIGSQSAWWAPLVGMMVGTAATVGLFVLLTERFGEDARPWAAFSYLVLPPAGAVVAAEWSHHRRSARSGAVSLVPLVRPGAAGVAVAWAF